MNNTKRLQEQGKSLMIERLPAKQAAFLRAYLLCFDIKQAMEQAGYKGASAQSVLNLKRKLNDKSSALYRALQELTERANSKHKKTAEEVRQEVLDDVELIISWCKEKKDAKNFIRALQFKSTLYGIGSEFEKEMNINICVSSGLAEAKERTRKFMQSRAIDAKFTAKTKQEE